MTTTVSTLHRYPVKSMLGEDLPSLEIDAHGVVGDRALALVDPTTGKVATAKQPRWWRDLLQCRAESTDAGVRVHLPGGEVRGAHEVDEPLTALLGRPVAMAYRRPDGALVERPDPEEVLAQGLDAELETPELEIAMGAPGGRFVDHSPLHLITAATLGSLGVEALRYRPNVVVAGSVAPFVENAWLGRRLRIGEVELEVTLPTPRCSVPTLQHGDLGRAPHALRGPADRNRVEVPGFGVLPCAGCYATVVRTGTIRAGDEVVVG
ncbi:MOSC domain-containing protein [Pseudonocardia sp. WMMC193]|uniref:MOSC domain-containing protein n=1 Tax=Pseudonocardia sp. WMMC193 TaxID=2911965 RepID=UPI001F00BFD1|nr:MOSC N-terminal beta barrel domain-containing protein [Pseudonocardia sp. WMMC193]MCF7547612.1 MOSC domain-containing protein [Pseudonocardia sp. WMMC193]